jgi:hypothetical protein
MKNNLVWFAENGRLSSKYSETSSLMLVSGCATRNDAITTAYKLNATNANAKENPNSAACG